MATLAADPAVERVMRNSWGESLLVPNDPLFESQWSLRNVGQAGGTPGADIDALGAWELGTGVFGGDVLPSLQGRILEGRRLDARSALEVADLIGVSPPTDLWVCDDGIDNDADGLTDHPEDPGCAQIFPSASESGACGMGFELGLLLPALLSLHGVLRPGSRRTRPQWGAKERS